MSFSLNTRVSPVSGPVGVHKLSDVAERFLVGEIHRPHFQTGVLVTGDASTSTGISPLQGSHQLAQKLTSTG